jgi:hypothetical protein
MTVVGETPIDDLISSYIGYSGKKQQNRQKTISRYLPVLSLHLHQYQDNNLY